MDVALFNVPVVFAKKAKSVNLDGEMYTAQVKLNLENSKLMAEVLLHNLCHYFFKNRRIS